jgi:sn-glycerol 3-phosphate transport system substrate-binding protein
MNTRLRALAVFSVVASLGMLPACGDKKDSASDGAGNAAACPVDAIKNASGPVTVKVWHSYVGKIKSSLEAIAADYNASQQKVKIDVVSQGTSYEELLRNFKNNIPTKQLPGIMIGEDTNTQFMSDSSVILPAGDCLAADKDAAKQMDGLLPAVKAAYTVNNVLLPASMNVSTVMLYINKDHFTKAGLDPSKPPTTLAELRTAAEKLKAANVGQAGPLVMKMDPWFEEQWINGAGGSIVNNNNGRDSKATAGTLDSDTAKEVMTWLSGMKKDGLLNAVPGTEGQINHYLAVGTQQSSMLLETSAAITTIDEVLKGTLNPKDLGSDIALPPGFKLQLNVAVAPNPGLKEAGKGVIGGGAWYITNTGSKEEQSAAWDFMKYVNSTPVQVKWNTGSGYLPIFDNVKDDPTIKKDWTDTQKGQWLATAYEGIKSLDPKHPGALIGPFDKFRDSFRKAVETVGLTGGDPVPALDEANKQITTELKNYADNNF